MRKRIYWMLPDLDSARLCMNDLLLARIAAPQIHFMGREGADMSGLQAAGLLQTSDLIPSPLRSADDARPRYSGRP